MKEKELETGYAFDSSLGAAYHFEHFPLDQANTLTERARNSVYVIETINGTFADKKQSLVHRNKYFTLTLAEAVGLAAHMQIGFAEVAEEIIDLRLATEEENEAYYRLLNHYKLLMPGAIAEHDLA